MLIWAPAISGSAQHKARVFCNIVSPLAEPCLPAEKRAVAEKCRIGHYSQSIYTPATIELSPKLVQVMSYGCTGTLTLQHPLPEA